jgi:hypothetical protein
LTTTFKVIYDLPYQPNAADIVIRDLIEHLSEFGSVSTRTQELVGLAIWLVELQFEDDDQAVMFKLKYGSEYDAHLMPNEDFRAEHQVMYIGG